jgi:predicted lysophospholipase L1 biosynthesis ABC-type transport system permease subunit
MFRRNRKLDDFRKEIAAHIAIETDRLRAQGLSEADARSAARRAFGNVTWAEERFYEARHTMWWEHLLADVRYALPLVNGLQPGAIMVRTRKGVAPLSVREEVQQALLAEAELPASKVRTMDQAGLDSPARQNFNLFLLGLFAAMALLLAAVGIYGVMWYSVEQRTHEIGIRTALGAGRGATLRLVLLQALRITLAGVAAGIAASFGLTRLLDAQLFGVKPLDPVTFVTVPLILIAVALAAACIPALRASRVDPMVALRHE